MVSASVKVLVGLTARRLVDGRVTGWQTGGVGEREGYMARVHAAGGLPVLLDPADASDDTVGALVARLDAVVLTGGPDVEPHRYGQPPDPTVYGTDAIVDDFELALARAAIEQRTPLFAICRGIQVLNVAYGGTLHQHIPALDGVEPHGQPGARDGARVQTVALEPDSLLVEVMGTTTPTISCHHHQAVDRVADGLRVVGRTADGIVEAIEPTDRGAFVLAVQWHPEDTAANDAAQQALFDAVVQAGLRRESRAAT